MVIAMAVVIVIAYFKYRLTTKAICGYWGTMDGKQYAIRAAAGGGLSVTGPYLEARDWTTVQNETP